MIVNNIDGSVAASGTASLSDLLALMADPKAYAAKLDELNAAIATNQKLVELVAPASEIVALRDSLKAEQAALKEAISAQKADAKAKLVIAQESADKLLADAKAEAERIVAEAAFTRDELAQANKDSRAAVKEAKAAAKRNDEATATLNAQSELLKEQTNAANAALDDALALKAEIIAKHKAFIESL